MLDISVAARVKARSGPQEDGWTDGWVNVDVGFEAAVYVSQQVAEQETVRRKEW